MKRDRRPRHLVLFAALFALSPAGARADDTTCVPLRLEVEGLKRLREDVIHELLPREPPACFSETDLSEFERRLWALGVLDNVKVERRDGVLAVKLREKWTLIPGADFAVGSSLRDSYFLVNVAESNLFGRAQGLFAYTAYIERQIGGEVYWWEHEGAAQRFTFEGSAGYMGSSVFFDEETYAWTRRRAAGRIATRFPFPYSSQHWRIALVVAGHHERSEGTTPAELVREGAYFAFGSRITWDRYKWHDVAPKGFKFTTELLPGGFVGGPKLKNRTSAALWTIGSIRFTETTALLANGVVEAVSPGDPNHSYLLGNIRGVRGLPDNLYRNAGHAFANVELRFATALAPRWFLQGVIFGDVGAYVRMNEHGATQPLAGAFGAGIGVRLVPTFLAWVVPRVDVGSLVYPRTAHFFNFGISQYF